MKMLLLHENNNLKGWLEIRLIPVWSYKFPAWMFITFSFYSDNKFKLPQIYFEQFT